MAEQKPLPPAIESKVQRILDSEARRILEERNRDSLSTSTIGPHDHGVDQRHDQSPLRFEGEQIPISVRPEREIRKAAI